MAPDAGTVRTPQGKEGENVGQGVSSVQMSPGRASVCAERDVMLIPPSPCLLLN